jgi:quinohemoprotein ethanol dehydrogenase
MFQRFAWLNNRRLRRRQARRAQRPVKIEAGPIIALTAILALSVCAEASPEDARARAANTESQDWLVNGGDLQGTHWSGLHQITETTVSQLGPAWSFDFDTSRGQESEPIVVEGAMYVTSAWSKVFALDAATGRQLWSYDPKVPGPDGARACCDVVNRGVAVDRGKVYVGTIDARLIALDAKTGRPIWSVATGENGQPYSITGAPRIVKGKVIVGNAGAEFGTRGYVTAYDAETGARVWRFYTVPGNPQVRDDAVSDTVLEQLARPTWFGDSYWIHGAGGTASNAITYDAELNQLYIGTGNGTPWNQSYRSNGKGDNLFLCSILALDPDTGRYIWHYQMTPGDSWDYDATTPIILTNLRIGGRLNKVLLNASKNGFFYVIDRTNGKLISAKPFVSGITWATEIDLKSGRPIEAAQARYQTAPFVVSPGPLGGHNWSPMALNPKTGLVYLAASESPYLYQSSQTFVARSGGPENLGVNILPPPGGPKRLATAPSRSYLVAWNPVAQKAVWNVLGRGGGALTTAGDLVFEGSGAITGDLAAFRATDGTVLWTHHLPNGVLAAPITYSIRGEQYVAVVSGAGARFLLDSPKEYASQVGRVVAFRLGGIATLPPDPGPPPPLNSSTHAWSTETRTRGGQLYGEYCIRCHGVLVVASNVVPDLRRSATLQDSDAWRAVVLGGALSGKGMISWSKFLTRDDAEAVRAYVDSEAQRAAGRANTNTQN